MGGLWFGHVAPADVLEVALIVLALWLIGHRLLRIPIAWLATVSVGFALVFLAITLVSLRETGALATWDALRTAGNWMGQDDRCARCHCTPGPAHGCRCAVDRDADRVRVSAGPARAGGASPSVVGAGRGVGDGGRVRDRPARRVRHASRGQPDARPVVIGSHRAGAGRRSAATSRPAAERLAERLLPPRLSGRAARDRRVARDDRRVAATAASRPLRHPRNRATRVLPVDRQRRAAHAALDEPARAGERSPCHRGAANRSGDLLDDERHLSSQRRAALRVRALQDRRPGHGSRLRETIARPTSIRSR